MSRGKEREARWQGRRLWLGLLCLGAIVALAWVGVRWGLAGRDGVWERIRTTGVWRVGMDPSFPPFENLDPTTGQPVGFDVDLAAAIARRWGVRLELVSIGFDQLVDAVAAHRVDAALSALPVLEHRAKEVAFSSPYIEAGIVLAVPRSSAASPPAAVSDLAGQRVAAEWGSAGEAAARRLARRLGRDFVFVLRDSAAGALAAVERGEADAAAVDAISLALYDRGQGRWWTVGEPLQRDPYVIYVPADAPRLLAALNEALAALQAAGTLDEIAQRWLYNAEWTRQQ